MSVVAFESESVTVVGKAYVFCALGRVVLELLKLSTKERAVEFPFPSVTVRTLPAMS